MLEINPDKRPSAQECLNHPWVQSYAESEETDTPFTKQTLKNLKKFKVTQKLQIAVINFIASQLTTQEERQQLENVFKQLDVNNDGKISTDELIIGLQQWDSSCCLENVEQEVKRIMNEVDSDSSGFIEFTEFVTGAMDRKKLLSQSNIKAAFRYFDLDKNGRISQDELKQFLTGGNNVSNTVWNDIIKEVDENGDGEVSINIQVDFREFYQMLKID